MSGAIVVTILTLLLGIQPVTTDLYLPALPTLQAQLGASIAAGLWLGMTQGGTAHPMTFAIGAFGAAVALVAWTVVQRHGETTHTALLVIEPRPA